MTAAGHILTVLIVAIATLVANVACVCAHPSSAATSRRCCLAVAAPVERGTSKPTECRHCHSASITASSSDRDAHDMAGTAPIATWFASIEWLDLRDSASPAPCGTAGPSAIPPPDVLRRRHVLQI